MNQNKPLNEKPKYINVVYSLLALATATIILLTL